MSKDKEYINFRDNLTNQFLLDHPFPNALSKETIPAFIQYILKK
jgi:hypothetical protein